MDFNGSRMRLAVFPAADGLGRRGFVHFVRSGKLPSGSFLSAFIGVHRRPIWGFAFALDREKKHIWPPMNADNPEVLRSGGSSGVAGISTFMSRTLLSQKDVPIHSVAIRAAMRGHEEVRNYSLRQGAKPWTVHCDVDARGIRLEGLDSGSGWESAADIL